MASVSPSPATRGGVAGRALAAIVGNYLLTSLVVALLARILPMAAAEATATATLASFAIFAVIAMAVFSARSLWRTWLWMGGAILVLGGALWISIATGGRL